MPSFFSNFPTLEYNIGSPLVLTNISKNVDVDDIRIDNTATYRYYNITNGERPDTVSYKLYGTSEYYWTFFVLNNHLRENLNYSWPLSSHQRERMYEKEYDPYFVITFLPNTTGIAENGCIQFISKYASNLRLVAENKQYSAKILKYDASLFQLVLYDCSVDVELFLEGNKFYVEWDNGSEELEKEFLLFIRDIYLEFDTGAEIDPELVDESSDIEAAVLNYTKNYVYSKEYRAARRSLRWSSMRNAAAAYSNSVYEVALDDSIVSPEYMSYYEKEEALNSAKEKIRVVSPSLIKKFSIEYFRKLRNE